MAASEAQLEQAILHLAQMMGWWRHGERPAQRQSGRWSTPIKGEPGWPDLVLIRGRRLLLWELKSDRGYLSASQKVCRDKLLCIPSIEYAVIRPREWDAGLVEKALTAPLELPQK